MHISPVSFGKKIPIKQCQIKDIKQNTCVDAFLFELDCTDYSDIEQIKKLGEIWEYGEVISNRMKCKFENNSSILNNNNFYIMEDTKGDIVGITEIRKEKPVLSLNYLETKNNEKYKYIGQSIIASLCEFALNNKFREIYIPVPIMKARNFYIRECGFKNAGPQDYALTLSALGMIKLRYKVRRKINSKINKVYN